jgi:hypothetical protein
MTELADHSKPSLNLKECNTVLTKVNTVQLKAWTSIYKDTKP